MTRDDLEYLALWKDCMAALAEKPSSPTLRRVAADLGITPPRGGSEDAGRPHHDCRSHRSMDGTHCNVCGEPVHPTIEDVQGAG